MKFRCTHNSIRLRLRKSEVLQLKQNGTVQEHLIFSPDQQLIITLCVDDKTPEIGAQFTNNNIQVSLPASVAHDWIATDKLALDTNIPTHAAGPSLHVLVEKDLSCKDREEDQSDYFDELGAKAC
jgi:hypothetical protein